MKNLVIAIQSFVITTIVYALLAPIFFEMENNAFGKGEYFVDDDDNNQDHMMYNQQVVETECKSPCPSSAEMCVAMCA
jgi:hypothetical protein